jgi:hypothetical protein
MLCNSPDAGFPGPEVALQSDRCVVSSQATDDTLRDERVVKEVGRWIIDGVVVFDPRMQVVVVVRVRLGSATSIRLCFEDVRSPCADRDGQREAYPQRNVQTLNGCDELPITGFCDENEDWDPDYYGDWQRWIPQDVSQVR